MFVITLNDILEVAGIVAGILLVSVAWICGKFGKKKSKGQKNV